MARPQRSSFKARSISISKRWLETAHRAPGGRLLGDDDDFADHTVDYMESADIRVAARRVEREAVARSGRHDTRRRRCSALRKGLANELDAVGDTASVSPFHGVADLYRYCLRHELA